MGLKLRHPHGTVTLTAVSGFLKGRKMKWLYLLALFQFVAGPLVILQVSLLCKLTVREIPHESIGPALVKAWHSTEFQAALDMGKTVITKDEKSPLRSKDPLAGTGKLKMPATPWNVDHFLPPAAIGIVAWSDWCRRWTPVWPQAPPGPPPRMG